jgi:hypothetical protein
MIDLEREHLRKTYQLCRTAFFALGVALVPASIMMLLAMVGLLGDPGLFRRVMNSPWNHWVSTVSVWASLVGTMLLWARWDHKSWQRRTGFLLFMCAVDTVLWFMDQSDGQGHGPGPGNWLRSNLGQALGWAEFALIASLTGDYLVHLGLDQAEDSARSTRSLAATGAIVWILQFCEQTNWDGGWPLRPRMLGMQGWLLFLGSELIWTITLVQVTALVIAAFRQSNRVLFEMHKEDQDHELLRFPSESAPTDPFASLESPGWAKTPDI